MIEEVTMKAMNPQPVGREANREQANRDELVERIARAVGVDGTVEPLEGVRLHRSSSPTELNPNVSNPALGVIAQGSKELYLGEERYRYDPYHYCLGTVELPVVSQIIEASPERPYLSLRLELDPILVGSVMSESGHAAPPSQAGVKAINVSRLDSSLLDAVGAPRPAHRHPDRSAGPGAAGDAGNCLSAADGQARGPAPSHRSSGRLYVPHHQSHQAAPARVRPVAAD